MKYYSETLNKVFDSEQECTEAEQQHAQKLAAQQARKEALSNERSARQQEVEAAYRAAADARRAYNDILAKYLKDYGSYHATFDDVNPLFDFFDLF